MSLTLKQLLIFIRLHNSFNTFSCIQAATTQLYTAAAGTGADHVPLGTVCSSTKPFQVCFKSDATESQGAAGAQLGEVELNAANNGFQNSNAVNGFSGFRLGKKKIAVYFSVTIAI